MNYFLTLQLRELARFGEDYLYPSTLFIEAKLPKAVQTAVIQAA